METLPQFGHFRLIRTLGKGITAKVKLAVDIDSGEEVALKIFRRTLVNRFEAERAILHRVTGLQNVVQVLDSVEKAVYCPPNKSSREVSYIAMEYCSRGELINYIFSRGAFPEAILKRCAYELLLGLREIHSHSIAHRDLKPENILLTEDFHIKIADFGFSKDVDGESPCYSFRGTKGYFAPEVLNRESYNGQKVDIFALGVVLFTLSTGRPPFTQAHANDRFYSFIEAENWREFWVRNQRIAGTPPFSAEFKAVIEKMVCRNPKERLTCTEALESVWLQDGVCEQREFAAWLDNSATGTVAGETQGEDGDSPYRDLQLLSQSSTDSEDVGLFRCSSRSPSVATGSPLAFLSKAHPDRLFASISELLLSNSGHIQRHNSLYILKARMPGSEEPLEFLCRLCEENSTTVRTEFQRLIGDPCELFAVITDVIAGLQSD